MCPGTATNAASGLTCCSITRAHSFAKCAGASPLVVLKAPSFLADAMLGSVARKLRIFGFDTLYIAHAHDDEILKTGIEQGRVILTADKELFKRVVKAGARGVLVSGTGSRCSICNGLLEEKRPDQVKNGVPRKVAELHREFYQCTTCRKVYWEGGHLTRIKALVRSVDTMLGRAVAT